MRKGFTTGAAATAAAKAHASFMLYGKHLDKISITLPQGELLTIPVVCGLNGAVVIKDAGDDPDVTHGAEICAYVELTDRNEIIIKGGKGIGTVTKAGLQIPVGEPAINPVPRRMIEENVRAVLKDVGAVVTISVPDGERLAEQTFNSRIGVVGGISIIGTTGIVLPMSTEAIIDTFKCEMNVHLSANDSFALVAGKIGEKHIHQLNPNAKTVMVSNYFGEAFKYMREKGIEKISVAGHPAKLAKLAMGYYNTHSANSPQAQDFVAVKLGLSKFYNTVEEICLEHSNFEPIARLIADKIKADYGFNKADVTLFSMKGEFLGAYSG
jgi:cobalt-precorrin-5B (C1)-methyltransferase